VGAITLDRLEELAREMKDWERKPIAETESVAVELVKLPARAGKRSTRPEKVALHVRLKSSFRGVFITSSRELEDMLAVLASDSAGAVAAALDKINRRVVEHPL